MIGSTHSSGRVAHGKASSKLALVMASAALVAAACLAPSSSGVAPQPSVAVAQPATPAATAGSTAANTATAAATPAISSPADWPVYHFDAGRSGSYPSFPPFTGALVKGWSAALDGAVYAEPLVVNGVVIAATEGDSVYAIDPTTGAVKWQQNLGTPVPLNTLPCGNIDPLGITGTPAYDPATSSVFAVAEVTGPHHILFALDPASGAVRWSRNVDLPGDDPRTHQQRPALAVANGYVYIGFGGLSGDCAQYIGEEVGVPTNGQGATISYTVPTSREGAIWATGGPVIDASGNLYVSVGNGATTSSSSPYDGSDSVLELSPTLQLMDFFAPSSWASDNAGDADLGSLSPVVVPGGWVFIAGKSGTGYVLHQGALGGIGGQVSSAGVCTGFGGAAFSGDTIYVPCVGSLREVQIGVGGSLTPGWQTSAAGGPPVIGGGAVWSVNTSAGKLVALNPATGATLGSFSVGPVPHFVSPTLWQDQVLVGTDAGITSLSLPVVPPPVVPPTAGTFHSVVPARILDTRNGTGGISGSIGEHVARTFQVTGGVVPTGAIAVTGNLTVTGQTRNGYLFIGPFPSDNPSTSNLNFPAGDDRANAVTVALGTGGTLSVTLVAPIAGQSAQVIFDVTGYFTADSSGATYHAFNPARILDTRNGIGGSFSPLSNHVARTFQVTGGSSGVPSNATAVTGDVTVTQQTRNGYLFVGPAPANDPTSSTLNFPVGDDRANAVTVALGNGTSAPLGSLSVTYVGSGPGTAHVLFDVTGYFTPDGSGSKYVPLDPSRILDTRDGTGGSNVPLSNHVARTFQVTGGGVASGATAVTGNLTVTQQTRNGYLFIGPVPADNPTSSTLNFPVGDDRASAVTVGLGNGTTATLGSLSVTYVGSGPGTAQVIFDVTGYFAP
jgi:outer membrane protein assembly factor BamB